VVGDLVYLAPVVPGFAAGVALCLPWARPARPVWLLVCLGYVLADNLVTALGHHDNPGLHWNWAGKALSVGLAGLVVAAVRPGRAALPLGVPVNRAGWRWSCIGIVASLLFCGGIAFIFRDHTKPGMEVIAFQATMPGLAEELCYRGVVFVLLGRAYAQTDGTPNAIPAAVIGTLLFGLAHAIDVTAGGFRFAILPFAYALVVGAGLAVVRMKARSVASCVLAHNVGNVCGAVMNGFG
jgi:membrane protease YdiL (CAAX protease family)